MKDAFVRHCRTLFATGSSARSVREMAIVFLGGEGNGEFMESMPELRWFQRQREGLGNEACCTVSWRLQCVTKSFNGGSTRRV
jgi:hypothetical protein